jgi:hypothetical protein
MQTAERGEDKRRAEDKLKDAIANDADKETVDTLRRELDAVTAQLVAHDQNDKNQRRLVVFMLVQAVILIQS